MLLCLSFSLSISWMIKSYMYMYLMKKKHLLSVFLGGGGGGGGARGAIYPS